MPDLAPQPRGALLPPTRILLHLAPDLRLPVDVHDIYLLEADGGDTLVRRRGRKPLRDLRRLGELAAIATPFGILRIHHDHAVNVAHIREIRGRPNARGWQVKMKPPVNRILNVSRRHEAALWKAFEGKSRS